MRRIGNRSQSSILILQVHQLGLKSGSLLSCLLLLDRSPFQPRLKLGYQVGLATHGLSSSLVLIGDRPKLTLFLLSSSRRVMYSTLTCVSSKFWSYKRFGVSRVTPNEPSWPTYPQLDLAHQRSDLFRLTGNLRFGFRVGRHVRSKRVSSENPWTSETSCEMGHRRSAGAATGSRPGRDTYFATDGHPR
jgi:hypothetical protein